MAGVEIHANAFETLMEGRILHQASHLSSILFALLLMRGGGRGVLVPERGAGVSGCGPHCWQFRSSRRSSPFVPAEFPLYSTAGRLRSRCRRRKPRRDIFIQRERMMRAEADKERYQQAIHFVVHEMRTRSRRFKAPAN
jgi:hypothetical protein